MRDYNVITKILIDKTNIEVRIINCLLFYLLYCSQNEISTIIWIPEKEDEIGQYLLQKYEFIKEDISICNDDNTELLIRIISSDGASIIGKDGKLKYYGCIVNLEKVGKEKQQASGTGENAAKILSDNGTAIKVSKDGLIKIFFNSGECVLKI